nr:hypothetical protein [uncultured Deefgea sp.]
MPKMIITDKTLPIAFQELDNWTGKLTWERYAEKLATILGEERISRHTLLSYPALVEAFKARKAMLSAEASAPVKIEKDFTLDFAKQQIEILEAKLARVERQNKLFSEQFIRWQHNLYMMPGVDMEKLNTQLDRPLPKLQRS